MRGPSALGLVAAAGLILAACGGGSGSATSEYAALCDIEETVAAGELAAANDEFLDAAHQGLHDLSTELAEIDRGEATALLEATESFESHVAAAEDPEATARSLELLLFEVENAYVSLGVDTAPGCSGDRAGSVEDALVAEIASYDLAVGDDERLLVGLFGDDMTFLSFGTVEFELRQAGEVVAGYEARFLPVPGYEAPAGGAPVSPALTRPSEGRGVYEAVGVEFDEAGVWEVTVTAEVAGESRTATTAFTVAEEHAVFLPGELTPRTMNPLPGDPEVDPRAIDSRADAEGEVPDPALHDATVAEYVDAGRPFVVVVSTPVFCVSRFCGPITDMVDELASEYGDEVGFVHLEVWEDFASNSLNDSALEWIWPGQQGDPAEPWVFLVGADGRLMARWDNVVDADELDAALQGMAR